MIRYPIIILWLLGLLAIPLGLIPSQVMNYLTGLLQSGASSENTSILPVILLFFLALVGMAMMDVIRSIIKSVTMESIVRNQSLLLFEHVLKAAPEFFRKNQTAKISNRIVNDIRSTEALKLDMKIGLPITLLGLLLFGYVMFAGLDSTTPLIGSYLPEGFSQQGNWFLGALVILMSPLQAVFLLFDKKIQKVRRATSEADDAVADISLETVSSVREFRNNFAFGYAIGRMAEVFENLRKVEIEITKIDALFSGIGPIINGLVKVTLLAVGARLCLGDMTLPLTGTTVPGIEWKDYMGFAGITIMVDSYVSQLRGYLFSWRMAQDAFRRINEFRQAQPLLTGAETSTPAYLSAPTVDFQQIDFETDDGIKILNGITHSIQPGEHVALVGPSGCGKSTVLNLILREINRTAGQLTLNQKRLDAIDFAQLTADIGYVQQKPVLLNTSIRNNLLLGLRRSSARMLEDDIAPLDISRMPAVHNLADLNREILIMVRKVGLEVDLIRKGLDIPVPASLSHLHVINNRISIQAQLTTAIHQQHPELLQTFDANAYLPSCSLVENIVFGRLPEADTAASLTGKTPLEQLLLLLRGTPAYIHLLQLGRQIFTHDQGIAARIQHQSPALFDVLQSSKLANSNAEELSASVAGSGCPDLTRLKPALQKVLLEMALMCASDEDIRNYPESQTFIDALINTRELLTQSTGLSELGVVQFDHPEAFHHLSLRQVLLGGSVNACIRNAHAEVDRLIIAELTTAGCLDDLILLGLEAPVGSEGRNLSGGQAQKIAIARTLLKQPSILLLDEATSALDEKSQGDIMAIVATDYADKTVIMVSHRLATITEFTRILVLERGHIVQQGTYAELVASPGLFQALVQIEKGEKTELQVTGMSAPDLEVTDTSILVTHQQIQHVLARNPLFACMQPTDIALLQKMSTTVSAACDSLIFEQGDAGDEFFIIVAGEVEFLLQRSGQSQVVDSYGPGGAFGELALLGDVPRTLTARCKTDATLCVINRDSLLKLLEIRPSLAMELLKVTARQIALLRDGAVG
ncbi:putative enzyme [Pseudomonas sp. 9AZ]|uniref:ATP-binding cassette domain-containing protein n=1 Tax=Pseudomonas sp. 9AZ TaxID=2653168 RepID=UPI0012F00E8B|nr:ATP-binding cassette domain-containing protein [Pseudomonas sp. 9AZ]VXD00167.1 putative enzyme [Pseudomonas sp. 9AZ]